MPVNHVKPPRVTPVRVGELVAGDAALLMPDSDLEGLRFEGVRRGRLDVGRGSDVAGCVFSGLVVDEMDLSASRLVETRFEGGSMTSLSLARSALRDVEFDGARLGAVEAFDLDVMRLVFEGCRVNYLNLRGSRLLDVEFRNCQIDELDLVQASAERVRLQGCRVGSLNVHDARLVDVDLRGAELDAVTGTASLRGAVVTELQLQLLARHLAAELGILVTD